MRKCGALALLLLAASTAAAQLFPPEQLERIQRQITFGRLPQDELGDAVVARAVVHDERLPERQYEDEPRQLVGVEVPRQRDLDADPDDDDQGEGRVEVRADRDELVRVGAIESVDRRQDPAERVLGPGGGLGE